MAKIVDRTRPELFEEQMEKVRATWEKLSNYHGQDQDEQGRLIMAGFKAVNKLRGIFVEVNGNHPMMRRHRSE